MKRSMLSILYIAISLIATGHASSLFAADISEQSPLPPSAGQSAEGTGSLRDSLAKDRLHFNAMDDRLSLEVPARDPAPIDYGPYPQTSHAGRSQDNPSQPTADLHDADPQPPAPTVPSSP
jgi:hypothetical protein